jgi:type I restriction enzyme S subunit
VPLLNEDAARTVRIPWPPLEVQRDVAAGLDAYRRTIRTPRRLLTRQIELLTERRQALISNAVTGQIEIPVAA